MVKMLLPLHLLSLLIALHVTGQESAELLTHHDSITVTRGAFSQATVAVAVPNEHLNEISSSVLRAESWIRTHFLAHYPATNISTIVVGHTLLCEKGHEDKLSLVLPTLKNIHYTLTRWGLHKEIKVSASFSSSCMHPNAGTYRADIGDTYIKPLLSFLQDINSPYLVNPPSHSPTIALETMTLLSSHSQAMKNLGFFNLNKINVVIKSPEAAKPTSRKLSLFDSKVIDPFPARPTPWSPSIAPTGSSTPAYAAKSPLSPLIGKISSPPLSLPFAPELPPMVNPASPPYPFHLPPCSPSGGSGVVAPPVAGVHGGESWCVAKPSVPPETLQEALDYACGEGGADCEAIRPRGNCYYPNTVVAHASYAFNSYWQKTKKNGGFCGFGGTAMLIDSDPSYLHCRFILM